MTTEPRAFATLDLGAATISVALIGKLARSWRLIGSCAVPSATGPDAAIASLMDRIRRADPDILESLGVDGPDSPDLVRLEVRSATARTLAIVAATERSLAPLDAAAARSGWRTVAASAQTTDPLAMTRMLLDGATDNTYEFVAAWMSIAWSARVCALRGSSHARASNETKHAIIARPRSERARVALNGSGRSGRRGSASGRPS